MRWMQPTIIFATLAALLSLATHATPIPDTSFASIQTPSLHRRLLKQKTTPPEEADNVAARVRDGGSRGRVINRNLDIQRDWGVLSNEEIQKIAPGRSLTDIFRHYSSPYEILQLLKPMVIRRVTHNVHPALLASHNNPRFKHSLRLLQFLRDTHSDSESAKALETWVIRLSEELESLETTGPNRCREQDVIKWTRLVKALVAWSNAYKTLNSITIRNIDTLNEVSDFDLEYFIMTNAKIRDHLEKLKKAATRIHPNDKEFRSSVDLRSRLLVAL
ncbi:hypothetical protein FRB95_010537 [Tulasnella sp. JGI-2019a]|nr:hypothetical protein FRB95_010537 [Tulasnella sp. JGI-2019a]